MLEETGYLTVPLRADRRDDRRAAEVVEGALAIVQGLEPPESAPVAGRMPRAPAKAADRYDPAMARLIDNLDLLSKAARAISSESAGSTMRISPT